MIMKFLLIILVFVAAEAAQEFRNAKPGCQDRCGNISIPYPFGTTADCYYSEDFFINCNTSFDPPTPFLPGDLTVTEITLDGKLHILNSVTRYCYDTSSGPATDDNSSWAALWLSKFIISHTDNVFVAIGCNTRATVKGYLNSTQDVRTHDVAFEVGCMSMCTKLEYVPNSICSGIGCCQTPLATGIKYFNVTVSDYSNYEKSPSIASFSPCSYAFIIQKQLFTFSPKNFTDLRKVENVSLALDWTIANYSCGDNKEYICQGNSTCVDPENGPGYRCKCLPGYEGNPYLPNGCQDINECEEGKHNCMDIKHCFNTDGNYTCRCQEGYHGDGRKYGEGCQRNQLQKNMIILLGCGSGLGILLLLIGFWSLYKIIKRRQTVKLKQKNFKRNGGLLLEHQLSTTTNHAEQIKVFNSKELEKATDNYHMNRILGHGGQGTVYKGMLTDGKIVAIKRSKILDEDRPDNFINEVVILSQINHRNVVKLIGCCLETEVPLLVYEFIPNGTLFQYIHNPNEEFPITWEMRLRVATEVASALAYLHSAASIPIYHRDVKSSNILLDEKFRAKVADFGSSRSVSIDQTHVTTQVQGTFGYLDPEYYQSSQFTEKSDVYSFGVVLVELLTGKEPISSLRSIEERSLVRYFLMSMEENRLFEILDARVLKEGGKEEVIAMAKLAEKCLNLNGKKRPTMKTVVVKLEGIRASQGVSSTINQQDYYEFDHAVGDFTASSNFASSSTGSLNSSTIRAHSDVQVQPLLHPK